MKPTLLLTASICFCYTALNMSLQDFLWAFFLSAVPVVELRGAIPLAIDRDVAWYFALPACVVGNMIPVPFLLKFLDPATRLVSRMPVIGKLPHKVFARTRRQESVVQKYGYPGLMVFVAIPLPGTGAWTGAILAFLLGMEFKRSLLAIGLGVLLAGIIVTVLSVLGWTGAIIAGVALVVLAVIGFWRL